MSVDQETSLNVKLQLGEVSETVEVSAGTPLLKTERSDVATTFTEKTVASLPILNRRFTAFELLTPGVQATTSQTAASEDPQGSYRKVVNGQSFAGSSHLLDGTDNHDALLGLIVINPTLESVTEAKVTTANYDAEFGATAGVISAQTKSGTNALRGARVALPSQRRLQRPQPVHPIPEDSRHGSLHPGHAVEPVRGRAGRSGVRRTSCSSSAIIRGRGATPAGRRCCACRRRPNGRATSAGWGSTSSIRPAARRLPSASSSPATGFRPRACRRRRRICSSSFRCRTSKARCATSPTTPGPAPSSSTRISPTPGGTISSAERRTCSAATALPTTGWTRRAYSANWRAAAVSTRRRRSPASPGLATRASRPDSITPSARPS